MNYFQNHYIKPSKRLTLELARELDAKVEAAISPFNSNESNILPEESFDKKFYKQPVMTESYGEPMFYRIERRDTLTIAARQKIRNTRLHLWSPDRRSGDGMEQVV